MSDERKKVLEAVHIKKYFPVKGVLSKTKSVLKAVDDVSIEIYEGETLGIVGETGCGKSTLGRTVLKLTEPTQGQIKLLSEDITNYSEARLRKLRQKMQIVFQDPYTSLNPRIQIGHALEEILTIHKIEGDRKQRVLDILKQVGLSKEIYHRYPHEFSGGQRQRIGIARALILNPSLLVCDEAVSALDVSIQAQIINLLMHLKEERKLAYLFISHDISVVRHVSDRIAVMYLGHIIEEGETQELINHPTHPYTKSLLSSVPRMIPHSGKNRIVLKGEVPSPINPPSGCVFHTRCPYATEKCRNEIPNAEKVNEKHVVWCHQR